MNVKAVFLSLLRIMGKIIIFSISSLRETNLFDQIFKQIKKYLKCVVHVKFMQ